MLNDLNDAISALDWARAQTIDFERRVNEWLLSHKRIDIIITPPPAEYDMIVAGTTEDIPRFYSVELGAYINTVRSALDILASTLAVRAGEIDPRVAAFPFSADKQEFSKYSSRAQQFLRRLPEKERDIITELRPYGGGDRALWSLHNLDIMRKHRRLLGVDIQSKMLQFSALALNNGDIKTLQVWDVYDATGQVVAMRKKGSTTPNNFDVLLHLKFEEEGDFGTLPIFEWINVMINKVRSVVLMFDN